MENQTEVQNNDFYLKAAKGAGIALGVFAWFLGSIVLGSTGLKKRR